MTEQNVLVDLKQVSEGFFLLLFLFLLFFSPIYRAQACIFVHDVSNVSYYPSGKKGC